MKITHPDKGEMELPSGGAHYGGVNLPSDETERLALFVEWGWGVVAEVPPTPGEITAQRDMAIDYICDMAKILIEKELNPLGGFRVVALANAGKLRAGEVVAWVEAKYMAVEVRKAEIDAGLWDDDLAGAQDFFTVPTPEIPNPIYIGKKPWTVAQILAE